MILRKYCVIFLFLLTPYISFALTVRVAVLDQLRSQKLSSVNYVTEYFRGIDVAISEAKSRGINVEYKYFPYDKDKPLDILNQVKSIEAYNPDFIIGPRSSDKLALLKTSFHDTLLISPLASGTSLGVLPDNFYSLALSDKYSVKALEQFVGNKFTHPKHIFIFTAIDCASCYGIGLDFTKTYSITHPDTKVIQSNFLANDVEQFNFADILKQYTTGDLIITPNLSYVSSIVIFNSLNYLKRNGVIFIGGDQWGHAEVSYVGKINTKYVFVAYRVVPWSLNNNTDDVITFKSIYKKLYGNDDSAIISYITYRVILSALSGINKQSEQQNIKMTILNEFIKKTKQNSNYFRTGIYAVYQVNKSFEYEIGQIRLNLLGSQ